jgi:hypothetical protein
VIAYRATLDVPRELAQFVASLLLAERHQRGTPRGSRALTCFWEAVLGLRWYRDRTCPDALARDHGISRATAYRYLDEVTMVLAAQAPDLHEALERAEAEGLPHVILDGKIIPADRCREKIISVKGKVIDLWYSGKAHAHGGNIQAVIAPDGFPLWVSPAEPGSVHDITAARIHALPPPCTAPPRSCPRWPIPAMTALASASTYPSASPLTGGNWTSIRAPATPCSAPCAASGNAGSPCSPSGGAPSSTSPPALAESATSPAPLSSSPISSTAIPHQFAEISSLRAHPDYRGVPPSCCAAELAACYR